MNPPGPLERIGAHWQQWDAEVSAWGARLMQTSYLHRSASILAHSGDTYLWVIAGVLLWYWGAEVGTQAGIRILLVSLTAGAVSTAIKYIFRRPRPGGERRWFYPAIDRHSMPSGHAARVSGLALVLGPLLPWGAALALALWALSVCASRVVLGLHYLSDVIVGVLVGVGVGALLLTLGL
jgi:undecaprenyl-diphosphatase